MSLVEIIESGNTRLAEWILEEYTTDSEYNVDVNCHDVDRETALMIACSRGDLEIVKLLLSRSDLEINLQDMYGRTALMGSCWRGHLEIVELLLSKSDININIRNKQGWKALTIAEFEMFLPKSHKRYNTICHLLGKNQN